jgi:LDH2 family malate/lactate/ureidoglycolate dehydrogenase
MPENQVGKGLGHFFGAMRIDAFMPAAEFKQRMDLWIETFRNAKPAYGCEKVLIPGDPERESEIRIRKEGIKLSPQVEKDMEEISEKFGIPFKN